MTELHFHTGLYAVAAVDVAIGAFASFADIERESREGVEIVRVTARGDEDEASLAGELANYVLGATVDGVAPDLGVKVEGEK
jgi:hypothetical protein